ncbi:MAG: polyprenyl diphosphate synthase [Actinomycetota bacterium]
MRIIEAAEVEAVAQGEIPRHIGCIMDGNGRWAQMRGLPRKKGHEAAEPAVVATVDACLSLGVEWLSAYAFSTENWKREDEEVSFLMRFEEWLLRRDQRDSLNAKGVQIRFLGRLDDSRIPSASRDWLMETQAMTAANTRLVLAIAFNYGGRAELVDAVNKLLVARLTGAVTEDDLERAMYVADMPDLDLVVRTSAEQRLSNFLPWHATYAELVFTDTLWPDFREWHLYSAVAEFQTRRRRRGAATPEPRSPKSGLPR